MITTSAKRERAITQQQLLSGAAKGKYYSYDQQEWRSMSCAEWWARGLLSIFSFRYINPPIVACQVRSWTAVEKMPTAPIEIARRIRYLFSDSLIHSNPSSQYSDILGRIFCKALKKQTPSLSQIDVQEHPRGRSFGIFCNGKLKYSVANSDYGQLGFYDTQKRKIENSYDSLWDAQGDRIGAIKLAVDGHRLSSSMELYSGEDRPLAKVDRNRQQTSLVFRHPEANQLLAVANFSTHKKLIEWTITAVDQSTLDKKGMTPLLLAWTTLKYSQHYHFGTPYYTSMPPVHVFRP